MTCAFPQFCTIKRDTLIEDILSSIASTQIGLTMLSRGSLLPQAPLSSSMASGLENFLLMEAATAGETAPV